MPPFPPHNSLYAADQNYRRSEDESFGDRSLVIAPDDVWKYVPVRRFLLFVEQSIAAGLQWTNFEPNGPALWARVSREIDDFLSSLFQRGELRGDTPSHTQSLRA